MAKSVVFLHGWGCDSRTWQPLMPLLQTQFPALDMNCIDLPGFGQCDGESLVPDYQDLASVLDAIALKLPPESVLVGWSLGGMLAVQLAAHSPDKISAVVTLAANAKFVVSDDYATAMPTAVNVGFNNQFAEAPAIALKVFAGLMAQGDLNERALLKQMRSQMHIDAHHLETVHHSWLSALHLLAELDNRRTLSQMTVPSLHLLAEKDVLVPVSAATSLSQLNSAHQVQVLQGAAHALHWSQPEAVAHAIGKFVHSVLGVAVIDKKKIAQSFGRAANQYDSLAHFQRKVGQCLHQQLPKSTQLAESTADYWVVDLGCGTGAALQSLQTHYPAAKIIALDLAEAMLHQARSHFASMDNASAFSPIQADAERLPFADQSLDVVYSNLVVQWCGSIPNLVKEIARVLKPGGQLIFSTLLERSLHELKSAWKQVDTNVHVNHFHSAQEWRNALDQYFVLDSFANDLHIEWFDELKALTRSIKGIGAKNLNAGRPVGLSGRQRIQAFAQAYEGFRQENLLPLTYDVLLVSAKKLDVVDHHE